MFYRNNLNMGGDEWGFRMLGRRHRRHGLGGFAAGLMGGRGFGGGDFRTGRKLSSGDLQLVILALLAEKPRHGYELIKALDERSGGFYVPSPGMIYPALTYLEEIGHATIEVVGARKQYHITESGKEHLAKNSTAADALFTQFSRVGERLEHLRRIMGADETGEGDSEER